MSTRTIKLKLLTQVSLFAVETGVRTLGEFKLLPEVAALNLKWNQIKLIDRATKTSIELDEALLPNIDCIIFLSPTKTDSGMADRKDLYAQIANLKQLGVTIPFNPTQTSNAILEEFIALNTQETTSEIFESNDGPIEYAEQESVSYYEATKYTDGSVLLQPITIEKEAEIEAVDSPCILEELADFTTNDELDAELKAIQKGLKK